MATAQSSVSVRPPLVFAAAWGLQRLMTRHRRPSAASRAASAVIMSASGALAFTAVAALARADTEIGPAHPDRASTLVTDGPYRLTRNPVYLALTGMLVAHAVLRRSAAALAPAAGFVAVLDRTQIPAEEDALAARFSRSYSRYRDATPRWVRCPGS